MELNLRRIKAEHIAKGYTQDVVAEKMGWRSRTPYAKRENGIVPFGADELAEFGNILGYGVNELGIFFDKNVPIEEQKGWSNRNTTLHIQISHVVLYHWGLINESS